MDCEPSSLQMFPELEEGCIGNPGRGEGRAGKQLQKHYIIDLFVNDPFFVIKLPKADGEMKNEKAS